MKLCVDTSAYSQFKRGHPEVVAALDVAAWVGMPAVTLGGCARTVRAPRPREHPDRRDVNTEIGSM